jgi:protein-S-isoprenylcysteine O-methyltransferase Ste14
MTSIHTLIAWAAWALLILVWLASAFRNRKPVRRGHAPSQIIATSLIILAFVLLFAPRPPGLLGLRLSEAPPLLAALADLLCVGGVAFAIWARLSLGRNWSGAVASVFENHELVRSGPYRTLRHPIYTGFLIAMLGTAITSGTLASYLSVLIGLVAFLLRIQIEEALMLSQFPEAYRTYQLQSWALIPCLY